MFSRRPGLKMIVAAAALLTVAACGGDDSEPEGSATGEDGGAEEEQAGDQEPVTINFTWWGDDNRADLYEQSLALFAEKYPHITVNPNFSVWDDYWPARATEAAGGALPDVMQMDLSFIRQYAAPGQLLPLDDYIGDQIDLSGFEDTLLPAGQIDGTTYGVPIGTNAFALFYNPAILEQVGVDAPNEIQTWSDYNDFIAAVSEAGAGEDPTIYGAWDYTETFWIFIHKLNQDGKDVFTEDGQIAFTEDDLRAWWNQTADLREAGLTYPMERETQIEPLGGFTVNEAASEMSWDNFLAGYLAESGAEELVMLPIPSDDPSNLGLFLKPSMLYSIGANSEHPEAAATLIDFLVNDPEVAEIFGTSKGLPASSAQRDAMTLEGVDAQVASYEESIAQYLSEAPPPPVEGFGTLEANFKRIGQDLRLGATSVDDAVDQWFAEAESVLNQ
jgi:multiple sugar transport system substrate-binding protein